MDDPGDWITPPQDAAALGNQAPPSAAHVQPPAAADDWATPESDKPTGALGNAITPILSYQAVYSELNNEARQQIGTGVGQLTSPKNGMDIAKGAWNTGVGALGYATSPISAAIQSLVGQPIENVTGIPKEYTDFAAALALPGGGLTKLSEAAPAVSAVDASGDIAGAASRLGFTVPKAVATDSVPLQAAAGAVKEMPIVGAPLVEASKTAASNISGAASKVSSDLGDSSSLTAGNAAKTGITNWITHDSNDIADRLYKPIDKLVDPAVTTPLSNTAKMASTITSGNAEAGLPPGRAVGIVSNALEQPRGLTYNGVKTLRTNVGEMLNSNILPDASKGDLKRIYGALSDDLGASALNAGGAPAKAAFDKANTLYSMIADKRETLAKIVGTDANAAPELVLNRLTQIASGKSNANIQALTQARTAMGSDNWNEVTSALINNMGRQAEGAPFSGSKFITSWNNLSDQGKSLLFNSTGSSQTLQSMRDLVTVSKAHKRLLDLGNPSGTGRIETMIAGAAGMAMQPLPALGTIFGGNMFARIMASPAAPVASKWGQAYYNAARNPGPVTKAVLARNSAALAQRASQQFGLDPAAIFARLQSPSAVSASQGQQNQQGIPRPPGQQNNGGNVNQQPGFAHGGAVRPMPTRIKAA